MKMGTIALGDEVCICTGTTIWAYGASITIGQGTYIGPRCHLGAYRSGITIGANVLLAPHCSMVDTEHKFESLNIPINRQGFTSKGIVIEDDVWLGTGVIVMDGVHIGRGAIVGAGAVVTHDVPPNALAVGIPARVLKGRNEVFKSV
jgi:acetyltransferase-like isoleucine patch superfamily enzyme